jgi:hypothetical protein
VRRGLPAHRGVRCPRAEPLVDGRTNLDDRWGQSVSGQSASTDLLPHRK